MGITSAAGEFILNAMRRDGPLGHTATLGELTSYMAHDFLVKAGWDRPDNPQSFRDVASALFGASSITSIDASDFEGANMVQDMNRPISAEYESRFDCLIDGGTLEHVFNLPVALDNCMRMLKPGGRYIGISPMNNLCGHGFYQFSPELYYRVFGADYGFEVLFMWVVESWYTGPERGELPHKYTVMDPDKLGRRVFIMSKRPLSLMVCARKNEVRDSLIKKPPHESDYSVLWEQGKASAPPLLLPQKKPPDKDRSRSLKVLMQWMLQRVPSFISLRIGSWWERSFIHSVRNLTFAKRVGNVGDQPNKAR